MNWTRIGVTISDRPVKVDGLSQIERIGVSRSDGPVKLMDYLKFVLRHTGTELNKSLLSSRVQSAENYGVYRERKKFPVGLIRNAQRILLLRRFGAN